MSTAGDIQNNNNLVAVIQVFRHGERSPLYFTPNDPYKDSSYWPDGIGALTDEGKRQIYNLGQYTRQRYHDFVPSEYSEKHFACYVTESSRSQLSAQAFINGFYPSLDKEIWNTDHKLRPVLNIAEEQILSINPEYCPAYKKAWTDVMNEILRSVKVNFREDFEYISHHAGTNFTDFKHLALVYDTLRIESKFGYELPEWTKSVYPEPLMRFTLMFVDSMSATEQMMKLSTGPFLNMVVEYFEKILKDPSSCEKFVVYSGHDCSVHIILKILKAFRLELPRCGCTIYFELRKRNNGEGYVNIYHKNEELEPITVPGAEFDCDLKDFKNLLSDYLIDDKTFKTLAGEYLVNKY